MTDEQALTLKRQRETEVAAQTPHNRRPITASLQSLRRRKQRRRRNQQARAWVQEMTR